MFSAAKPLSLTAPTRTNLLSHTFITNALRLFWVVVIFSGELGSFFWSLAGCRWPTIDLGHNKHQPVRTAHVLLVADTQVQHPAVTAKTSWWASPMRRVMFELNLRKSWHVTSRMDPHVVVFLGDMLANGKAARTYEEYELAAEKFKSIFNIDHRTAVYYVPGNNDVGLGNPQASQKLNSFYTKSFGPLNQKIVISNHTFVALNAPGLVDEDYQRHAAGVTFDDWKPIADGPVSFVKELEEYDPGHVILLNHIPLTRAETADCGPLREKGTIGRGAGPGYLSMMGRETTNFLLKHLQPLVVFSADNRDYCEYTHTLPNKPRSYWQGSNIREVTLKSFSMSVHIKRPGFQLLSLVDPAKLANPDLPSFADAPCFLPDQYRIYNAFYTPLLCITLLILLALNIRARARGSRGKPGRDLSLTPSPSPRSSGRNTPNPMYRSDPAEWSAMWSPFSPVSFPNHHPATSPRGTLPTYLRTPKVQQGASSSTQHLVASSRPSTPGPSSPIVPMGGGLPFSDRGGQDDAGYEDEDDTMYPAQYAMRTESRRVSMDGPGSGSGWAHVPRHNRHRSTSSDEYDMLHDQEMGSFVASSSSKGKLNEYISAPAGGALSGSSRSRKWQKSYTFVFRGRRRRITLGLPSWKALHNLLDLFGFGNDLPGLGLRSNRGGGVMMFVIDLLSVFWPAVVVWGIINWTIL